METKLAEHKLTKKSFLAAFCATLNSDMKTLTVLSERLPHNSVKVLIWLNMVEWFEGYTYVL